MIFQSKLDRIMNLKEEERKKREQEQDENPVKLEKSDFPAMLLAALITIGPVVAIVLLLLVGVLFLLF